MFSRCNETKFIKENLLFMCEFCLFSAAFCLFHPNAPSDCSALTHIFLSVWFFVLILITLNAFRGVFFGNLVVRLSDSSQLMEVSYHAKAHQPFANCSQPSEPKIWMSGSVPSLGRTISLVQLMYINNLLCGLIAKTTYWSWIKTVLCFLFILMNCNQPICMEH